MQVIQTSVLLKYSSLFGFLQRQAPAVATELQRVYVGAARLYYETGFRRYARTLGVIKVGYRPLECFHICYNMSTDPHNREIRTTGEQSFRTQYRPYATPAC